MSFNVDKKKLIPLLAVELVVPEGEYEGTYRTRIEEVGENSLFVGMPFIKGNLIPLRIGTKLQLLFWDELSAYSFSTKIIRRIAVPIHMLVLEMPNSILKEQRRNFVRVTAIYPITFQTVTKEAQSDIYKGTTTDISGGGMSFLTEEQVENRSLLNARLELPNGDLQTLVTVRRADKIEDSTPQRYRVMTEFHEIPERDRDKVIRCIFEIQRTMRKKGLV